MTLTAAELSKLAVRYGPLIIAIIQGGSGLVTDHHTRKSAAAQKQAAHVKMHAEAAEKIKAEFPKLFEQLKQEVQPREVRIPQNSFNSSKIFTDAFVGAA